MRPCAAWQPTAGAVHLPCPALTHLMMVASGKALDTASSPAALLRMRALGESAEAPMSLKCTSRSTKGLALHMAARRAGHAAWTSSKEKLRVSAWGNPPHALLQRKGFGVNSGVV
jgi:hypothetical protein